MDDFISIKFKQVCHYINITSGCPRISAVISSKITMCDNNYTSNHHRPYTLPQFVGVSDICYIYYFSLPIQSFNMQLRKLSILQNHRCVSVSYNFTVKTLTSHPKFWDIINGLAQSGTVNSCRFRNTLLL